MAAATAASGFLFFSASICAHMAAISASGSAILLRVEAAAGFPTLALKTTVPASTPHYFQTEPAQFVKCLPLGTGHVRCPGTLHWRKEKGTRKEGKCCNNKMYTTTGRAE